jgi:hypothetical protein
VCVRVGGGAAKGDAQGVAVGFADVEAVHPAVDAAAQATASEQHSARLYSVDEPLEGSALSGHATG